MRMVLILAALVDVVAYGRMQFVASRRFQPSLGHNHLISPYFHFLGLPKHRPRGTQASH